MPVIPATQEAEAGELPEPRRWRLHRAEMVPLHSSLGNKSETPSLKKKKDSQNIDGVSLIKTRLVGSWVLQLKVTNIIIS